MLAVLFYEPVPDVLDRAPAVMPRHGATIDAYAARGELLLVGTFEDPVRDGAMCVFRTREAAEAFAAEDPFVVEGLVARWEIKIWNELLLAPDAAVGAPAPAG
jgi:uncharacterized protein